MKINVEISDEISDETKINIKISDEFLNQIREQLELISEKLNRKYDENCVKKITDEIITDMLNEYLNLEYISDDDLKSYILEYFPEIK